MTPPRPQPMRDSISGSGAGTELGVIEEAANSVRRMQANEDFDKDGLRTIWHRGRKRTEMLSWENRDNEIVRQELSIFGMMVEYRAGAVRTGDIPNQEELSSGGKPMSHLVQIHEMPNERILEYASHLLRHLEGRDFYAQHLLKHVNAAIASFGFDESRTAVNTLSAYSRSAASRPTQQLSPASTELTLKTKVAGKWKMVLITVGLALAGAAVGVGVGYLLGFIG